MTRQRLKKGQRIEARLSEQQCELIGEFIANRSHLELVLEKPIWHFLKLQPDDGRIITSTLDARPKVRMIRELAKRHIGHRPLRKQLLEVIEVIEELQGHRNFVAHGVWSTMMPDGIPMALSLRAAAEPGHITSEIFPKDRMETLIETTRDIGEALEELPAALDASQKKYAELLHRLKTTPKLTPTNQNP
jgi:hypothetical protein